MKTLKSFTIAALMLLAVTAEAADMGTSAGFDLDALMATVRSTYDLDREDAVVLLNDREVTLTGDHDLVTTVHTAVWINSSTAIHAYADLRIPWNMADSELDVEVLRTWRDDRWWPDSQKISETAVVPTLPYAVAHADDYTSLRETMLLHDGIELPCVVETRYTITRHGVPAASGTFVFPQRDPAVRSRLSVSVPDDAPWHAANLPGAPRPAVDTSAGAHTTVWNMETAGRLGLPVTSVPADFEPAVVYSTWESWQALGRAFNEEFDTAAHLEGALADSIAAVTTHLSDPVDQVNAVLDFVQDSTRNIRHQWRLWAGPRPAMRTWETGYGNGLDRVVLAAAALRSLAVTTNESGTTSLSADPIFLGYGTVAVAPEVPRIDDDWDLALDIGVLEAERLFWSHDGTLHGSAYTMDRPVFVPRIGQPVFMTRPGEENLVRADLELKPTEDGGWSWSGTLTAQGDFCPHGDIFTGESLDKAAGKLLGDVLPDADVDSSRPRTFTSLGVALVCDGSLAGPDESDDGAIRLTIGDPGDGVLNRLPHDIHLYESERSSPALLPAMGQEISVRIPLDGYSVAHLPSAVVVDNAAGRCTVSAKVSGGWLVYRRSVKLTGEGSWPDLRAVLLEAQEGRSRDIVLKTGGQS